MDRDSDQDEPLRAEAAKREEWRGGDTQLPSDAAPGHTLPASEDNDEGHAGGGAGASAAPTIIPPPD